MNTIKTKIENRICLNDFIVIDYCYFNFKILIIPPSADIKLMDKYKLIILFKVKLALLFDKRVIISRFLHKCYYHNNPNN